MEDNNQTNIEKADEIAGYFGNTSMLAGKKISPYTDFLTATPAAITSLGVLIDKIDDGTAQRHDYVHAVTSLGGVGVGVAGLMVLGGVASSAALPVLTAIGIGLAVWDYADEHGYDVEVIKDDLVSKAKELGEMLGEAAKFIPDGPEVEKFFADLEKSLIDLADTLGDTAEDALKSIQEGILEGLDSVLPDGLLMYLVDTVSNELNAQINTLSHHSVLRHGIHLGGWITYPVRDDEGAINYKNHEEIRRAA